MVLAHPRRQAQETVDVQISVVMPNRVESLDDSLHRRVRGFTATLGYVAFARRVVLARTAEGKCKSGRKALGPSPKIGSTVLGR